MDRALRLFQQRTLAVCMSFKVTVLQEKQSYWEQLYMGKIYCREKTICNCEGWLYKTIVSLAGARA